MSKDIEKMLEQHQSHLDGRLDTLEEKVDLKMQLSSAELKEDIVDNKNKIDNHIDIHQIFESRSKWLIGAIIAVIGVMVAIAEFYNNG